MSQLTKSYYNKTNSRNYKIILFNLLDLPHVQSAKTLIIDYAFIQAISTLTYLSTYHK